MKSIAFMMGCVAFALWIIAVIFAFIAIWSNDILLSAKAWNTVLVMGLFAFIFTIIWKSLPRFYRRRYQKWR
jgi:membrane protein YdbS with pleckstrin-like domain